MVNLEVRKKFTRWKKKREFHDNESENISSEGLRRLLEGGTY